jgi:hypothetical protein
MIALTRIFSMGLVVGCFLLLGKNYYKNLFIPILYTHYLLAFYFSRRHLTKVISSFDGRVFGLALATLSAVFIFMDLPITVLIGIHISLSEVYMLNKYYENNNLRTQSKINLFRFILNISTYLLLLEKDSMISSPLFKKSILTIALLSFVVIVYCLSKEIISSKFRPKIYDLFFFEVAGLSFLLIGFFSPLNLTPQDFVFYHISTWLLFPYFLSRKTRSAGILNFFILNIGISTFLFLAATYLPIPLESYVPAWAVVHILSSFILSPSYNPNFINRIYLKN